MKKTLFRLLPCLLAFLFFVPAVPAEETKPVYEIEARDSFGNPTQRFLVQKGDVFAMIRTRAGDQLIYQGRQARDPDTVELRNELLMGMISGHMFKNGILLDQRKKISPQQKAIFDYKMDKFYEF
jgi:hypothetical protein